MRAERHSVDRGSFRTNITKKKGKGKNKKVRELEESNPSSGDDGKE